jgi:hypothetical protein
MADDAQTILAPLSVDNGVKADAWEAFNSAKNENDLGVRLQGINLPQNTKADLWEAKKHAAVPPLPPSTIGPQKSWSDIFSQGADAPVITQAVDKLRQMANFTPEGQQQHPIQAQIGQLADRAKQMLVGGQGGGLNMQTGFVTNPVTSMIAGAPSDEAINATRSGVNGLGNRILGKSPARIAELEALPKTEEAVRQRIVAAESTSRAAFKSAYDSLGIDAAPVNVANAKNIANNAAEELEKFTGVPRTMAKVQSIPEPSESLLVDRQVRSVSSAGDLPTTERYSDPADILKQLSEWDQVPFRDAQRYRSNIEQYISKSRQLPTQVYNALKQVSGALSDGLETTADTEGKLADFQAANQMFKEHAADFWNKNAPLKSFLSTPADATGTTLNRFTQTATQSRALDALDRRGIPTEDLRALLSSGTKALRGDIQKAATLRNLGEQALQNQTIAARQALLKKYAIPAAIGTGGAGLVALYESLKK